jgi:hypothetical protein
MLCFSGMSVHAEMEAVDEGVGFRGGTVNYDLRDDPCYPGDEV